MNISNEVSLYWRGPLATLLLAMLLLAGIAGRSTAAEQLFEPVVARTAPSLTAEQESRAASLLQDKTHTDLSYVVAAPAALQDRSVSVPLPKGEVTLGLVNRIERSTGDFTWIGEAIGEGGQSVLVVRDGQITGIIYDGFVQYSITPLGGDLHALTKVDYSAFPPDHPPGPLPRAPRTSRDQQSGNGGTSATTEVDVLGAYTPQCLFQKEVSDFSGL